MMIIRGWRMILISPIDFYCVLVLFLLPGSFMACGMMQLRLFFVVVLTKRFGG